MKKSILIAFAVMFIAVAHSASGAGYAYEPFTDPAFGPLSGVGQWLPGSSWVKPLEATRPITLTWDPVGLTYKSLKTQPGALTLTTTTANTGVIQRDLATTYVANDDYWVSYLLRNDVHPGSEYTNWSPQGNDGGAFGYHWGTDLKFVNSTTSGITPAIGQTNMVVLHYINANTIDLWVDPVLSPAPPAPLLTQASPWAVTDMTKALMKCGGGAAGGQFTWDEIRIGQSWEAVTVPEPATFSLLGIGLLALIRRRK